MKRRISLLIVAALLLFASTGNCLDFNKYRGFEPETVAYAQLPGAASTHAALAALDTNIRSIKYGFGITLSSVAMNISAVDGTAFLSNPSTDLRPYCNAGWKATITDAAGKYNTAILGAVGTGESLDTELIIAWTNSAANPYEAWDSSSPPNVASAINTTGGGRADFGNKTAGILTKNVFNPTFSVGTSVILANGVTEGNPVFSGIQHALLGGESTKYITISSALPLIGLFTGQGTNVNYSATCSSKQVLTPSNTGCTLLNAAGAQSFISKDAAFTYNAASYTVTITKD